MPIARLKAWLHPRIDPLLSLPDRTVARLELAQLADGVYRAGVQVPYYAQFASPERTYDYIYKQFDGTRDPNWRTFGAPDRGDYAFWAPRACAIAVLKMAIEAFYPDKRPTFWQLVSEGLRLNGYTVRDARGNWIDEGWYVDAQMQLAARYGLLAEARGYISLERVCTYIRSGWLVAATVTPQLGERQTAVPQYGGHLVLVHGFEWQQRRPTHFWLHNPSGRYIELRANARIPAARFEAGFAHRLIAFRPRNP